MATANTPESALVTLQDDIGALKRDVTSLLAHLQRDASTTARSAAAQLDDGAHRAYRSLASSGTRSIEQVGKRVEARPVAALILALGIGYLGGRFLSR